MSADRTHYADPATLARMLEMEREIERLRGLLREWLHYHPSDGTSTSSISARTRAALEEGR